VPLLGAFQFCTGFIDHMHDTNKHNDGTFVVDKCEHWAD